MHEIYNMHMVIITALRLYRPIIISFWISLRVLVWMRLMVLMLMPTLLTFMTLMMVLMMILTVIPMMLLMTILMMMMILMMVGAGTRILSKFPGES